MGTITVGCLVTEVLLDLGKRNVRDDGGYLVGFDLGLGMVVPDDDGHGGGRPLPPPFLVSLTPGLVFPCVAEGA